MAGAEGTFAGARSRLPRCLPERKAAPWAQGPPSTSRHEPWAPAPSSCRAWGSLDETAATPFEEGRSSSVTRQRPGALPVAQPPMLESG